jgi:AbrB family looped-hinge helix DNA binding protein
MSEIATLSAKFQISIPKAVREAQAWRAGQEFVFIPKGKGVLVMPVPEPEDLRVSRRARTRKVTATAPIGSDAPRRHLRLDRVADRFRNSGRLAGCRACVMRSPARRCASAAGERNPSSQIPGLRRSESVAWIAGSSPAMTMNGDHGEAADGHHALHPPLSCPALSRASRTHVPPSGTVAWIAGSSPAMTRGADRRKAAGGHSGGPACLNAARKRVLKR